MDKGKGEIKMDMKENVHKSSIKDGCHGEM